MVTIDEALTTADREWRALGVTRRDRIVLAADLRLDLEAAAADGIAAKDLLDGDVRGFARRLAEEADVRRAPGEYSRVLATAVAGAFVGALAGALVVGLLHTALVALFDLPRDVRVPVALAAGIYYGGTAAITIGGAVLGVRFLLRRVVAIRRTAAAMGLLLPVAAAIVAPLVVAVARSTGYSTAPTVVLVEVALAVAAFAGVTVLARRWSLRPQ